MARPAMKTDSTSDSTGVTMPKCANAMRSQTTWYNRLQKPEQKNSRNRTAGIAPRDSRGRAAVSSPCIRPHADQHLAEIVPAQQQRERFRRILQSVDDRLAIVQAALFHPRAREVTPFGETL